jgi:hypothetical protein
MSAAHRLTTALAATVVCAVACTGHYTVPIAPADAAPVVDVANACKGALFDRCTEPSQCMSGDCKDYVGSGFTVCTEACTGPGTYSCPPDSTGSAAFCNNMGLCKPAKPNDCTL